MADSNGAGAWFFDGVATPAQDIRLAQSVHLANGTSRAFGARAGRRTGVGGVVTVAGSTATISAGSAVVDPQGTGTQGPYEVAWRSAQTVTLQPADSSNDRVDVVYVRVFDGVFDASGQQAITFGVAPGTPSGTPVAPSTLPDGTQVAKVCVLATVRVPKSGGGASVVTPGPQVVAAGGIVPAKTAAQLPTNPVEGDYADLADADVLQRYSGLGWDVMASVAPMYPYTPLWGSDSAVNLGAGGTLVGRYRVVGKRCEVFLRLLAGGSGFSAGTGTLRFGLPVAGSFGQPCALAVRVDASDGRAYPGWGEVSGSSVVAWVPQSAAATNLQAMRNADSTAGAGTGFPQTPNYPLAQLNNAVTIQGWYEVA